MTIVLFESLVSAKSLMQIGALLIEAQWLEEGRRSFVSTLYWSKYTSHLKYCFLITLRVTETTIREHMLSEEL